MSEPDKRSQGDTPQTALSGEIAVDNIPDPVVVVDPDTREIVTANAAAGRLFHCHSTELIGRHQEECHPADEQDAYFEAFQRAAEGKRVNRLADGSPLVVETVDGQHTPVEVNAKRIETVDGTKILGIFRGVPKQLARERQLRETTTRLETLLNALPIPAAVIDTDGTVTRWNPASETTFGYSAENILGEPYPLFVDDEEFDRLFERVMNGRGLSGYETEFRADDGALVPVEIYAQPLLEDGVFSGVIGAAIDVSDKRQRERQLTVLHRVLRHNLRNDLNAIAGWTTQLTPDDAHQQEAVERIEAATDRLIALADDATDIRNTLTRTHDQPEEISADETRLRLAERFDDDESLTIDEFDLSEQITVARRGVDTIIQLLQILSWDEASIAITAYAEYVRIEVTASTPILPPGALASITGGTETALEHDADLAVVKTLLTIDNLGGTLTPVSSGGSDADAFYIELPRTDIQN